jgi:hypothetical protein
MTRLSRRVLLSGENKNLIESISYPPPPEGVGGGDQN